MCYVSYLNQVCEYLQVRRTLPPPHTHTHNSIYQVCIALCWFNVHISSHTHTHTQRTQYSTTYLTLRLSLKADGLINLMNHSPVIKLSNTTSYLSAEILICVSTVALQFNGFNSPACLRSVALYCLLRITGNQRPGEYVGVERTRTCGTDKLRSSAIGWDSRTGTFDSCPNDDGDVPLAVNCQKNICCLNGLATIQSVSASASGLSDLSRYSSARLNYESTGNV